MCRVKQDLSDQAHKAKEASFRTGKQFKIKLVIKLEFILRARLIVTHIWTKLHNNNVRSKFLIVNRQVKFQMKHSYLCHVDGAIQVGNMSRMIQSSIHSSPIQIELTRSDGHKILKQILDGLLKIKIQQPKELPKCWANLKLTDLQLLRVKEKEEGRNLILMLLGMMILSKLHMERLSTWPA